MKNWLGVTGENRCPICNGSTKCKISPDADEVTCKRTKAAVSEWYVGDLRPDGSYVYKKRGGGLPLISMAVLLSVDLKKILAINAMPRRKGGAS